MRPTTASPDRWRGLAAMLVGTFAAVLSLSFLFPATPQIMADFGVTIEAVAWLSLAYALGAAVFEPMWGRLGDLTGRKRNALLGLALFTIGALGCALSPSMWVMAGARFVQGLGAAAIIPIGMAFIGENFPTQERGRAFGAWGMVNGAAPAFGPTLGGYLIDWFGWRSIYWASILLGLAGIAAIALVVRESRRPRAEPFDVPGSALLFVGVGSLLVALNQGRTWGWTSPFTLGSAGASLLFLAVFVAVERRTAHPIVDLGVVRTRLFAFAGASVFLSFLVFQGAFFLIPFFLQQVQGYPASQTGQLVMPLFLGIMAASIASGRASDRVGARLPATLGAALTAGALFLLSRVQEDTSYAALLAVMALLGLGIGATLPPLSRAVTGGVPLRQIGAASGVFNMVRNLGGPFGIAIGATLFAQRAGDAGRAFVADRVAALGLDPQLLVDLPRLRELAAQGALDATQRQQLELAQQFAPQLQALQRGAAAYGLQAAFTDVAFLMFVIACLGIVTAFVAGGGSGAVSWTPEALALLGRFPEPVRARARRGLERAALRSGLHQVTDGYAVEAARAWRESRAKTMSSSSP